MKSILSFCFLLLSIPAFAQPSEAEIKKQISNAGTKAIRFTKSTGTRQWNRDIGNWEYVRGVEVIRSSDYPGIDLVVSGDVVYQYTGVGKYSYWKFRTLENHYLGIPNPSQKEIDDFISKDWPKFYGFYYQVITKLWFQPVLADNPEWIWHSPNSVEFRMKMKFDHIIRGKGIETLECIWKVRLYRDDPKAPWKNMIAIRSEDASDLKVTDMKNYTVQQLSDFEKQTLAYTLSEQQAQQQAAALSATVTIPDFKDAEEMVRFIHDILRNGTPEQFKAVMLRVMAPGFFVEGSKVQLRPDQEQNLQDVITAAYNSKASYKLMYCQQPDFRIEKWGGGSTKKTIYIAAAVNNCQSSFTISPVNTGYKEGVPQTALRIVEYGVYIRQDADALAFIQSFSDRKKICGKD